MASVVLLTFSAISQTERRYRENMVATRSTVLLGRTACSSLPFPAPSRAKNSEVGEKNFWPLPRASVTPHLTASLLCSIIRSLISATHSAEMLSALQEATLAQLRRNLWTLEQPPSRGGFCLSCFPTLCPYQLLSPCPTVPQVTSPRRESGDNTSMAKPSILLIPEMDPLMKDAQWLYTGP